MSQEPGRADVEEEPIAKPDYASQDIDDKSGVTWDHPIERTGVKTPQPPEVLIKVADEGEVSAHVSAENEESVTTQSSGHHEILETPSNTQFEVCKFEKYSSVFWIT